jgi:hypothetical protein
MKISKTTTTLSALNLALFISLSAKAVTYSAPVGDIEKTTAKNQASAAVKKMNDMDETRFDYLRFDVNKFTIQNETEELPVNSLDYLRFDVNKFVDNTETEITELPCKEGKS